MTAADAWSVAEAKARLSELLDTVGRDGPQTISRRGRPVAVLVSIDEWERGKRRRGSLADFFDAGDRSVTYLIDTNVVSEFISASPDRRAESWLRGVDEDTLLVSAITLGELRFGIELLPAGRQLAPADGLIAATAFCHDLVLVTRNSADFRTKGVELLNPWHEDG